MFNIFENPWGLLIIGAVALLVIWVFRSAWQNKMRWWFWIIPFLIGGTAFGIDYLVETDKEKIQKTILTLIKDFEQENCDAIASVISENYSDSYHATKRNLVIHCITRLDKPVIEKAIPRIISIEQFSPKATADFTVRVLFDKESDIAQLYKQDVFFKIQANLKKQSNTWLINRVEIIKIDNINANWHGIGQ